MPNTREKLIELLWDAYELVNNELPTMEMVADRLIANGVTVNEWISVKDRLPKKRTFVLGVTDEFVCECIMLDDERFWMANTEEGDGEVEVTHWMPLPQPPKGE